MDWVISNKEWLFSGLGLLVLTGVFKIFFTKDSQSQNIKGSHIKASLAGRDVIHNEKQEK